MNNLINPDGSLNRQAVYEKVAKHLLAQGKRALSDFGTCRYRGERNTQCAIGCLISDEHYSSTIEGFGCRSPSVERAVAKSIGVGIALTEGDIGFLAGLQAVHDGSTMATEEEVVAAWPERIRKFAADFELQPVV